ncbi:hypothetical protein A4X03_0g7885 [Tilletia caries]|uniref:Helicase ATP-binding domain-containing protein n=1 Tax=Tilletia caries TaxID=13290 RepID=A0A8T8SL19_9BASI|nr:hypothetical protein A4X03_0g7885 [Tilletia caries]
MPAIRSYSWKATDAIGAHLSAIRTPSGSTLSASPVTTEDHLPSSLLGRLGKRKRAQSDREEEGPWSKRAKNSSPPPRYDPKQYQLVATDGVRNGKDVIVKAPTSTGKGEIIDYVQKLFPDGVVIVAEPLQLLVSDFALRFGTRATYVDATHKSDALLAEIRDGKYKLVFATAESLTEGAFLNKVLMHDRFRSRAAAFIFDEAHTLDQWGRDFRPKFLQLGEVRRHLQVPAVVMSATLTKQTQRACETTLELTDPLIVDVGTNRPNLYLRILPMRYSPKSFLDILSLLPELWERGGDIEERTKNFPVTLIYVNNKDLATNMYTHISKWSKRAGFDDVVDVFHADMSEGNRTEVRKRLDLRQCLIAICTDAFGMGADCRLVLRAMQHLEQPSAESLPDPLKLYSSSGPIEKDRKLRCCSTCDPLPLSEIPEELIPSKEIIPSLPGIMAMQKVLRSRLEDWRSTEWEASWKASRRAGRLGINAFLSFQDIDSLVNNLKTIAHGFNENDSRLGSFVGMRFKSDVLPGLEDIVRRVLEEEETRRQEAKDKAGEERRLQQEEARKRREAKRDARSAQESLQRVQAAEASGSRVSKASSKCCLLGKQKLARNVSSSSLHTTFRRQPVPFARL